MLLSASTTSGSLLVVDVRAVEAIEDEDAEDAIVDEVGDAPV